MIRVLLLAILLSLAFPQATAAKDGPTVVLRGPEKSAEVAVTVEVPAKGQAIVELRQARGTLASSAEPSGPDKRTVVLFLPVRKATYKSLVEDGAQLSVVVKKQVGTGPWETAAFPVPDPQQDKNEVGIVALTSVSTAVTTLVALWIGSLLTRGGQQRADRLAARRADHDRNLPAVKDFLAAYRGGTDPRYLKESFEGLVQRAVLPASVHTEYRTTLTVLSDPALERKLKEQAAATFRARIEALANTPS